MLYSNGSTMCACGPLRCEALPVAATNPAEASATAGTTTQTVMVPRNTHVSSPTTTNAPEITFAIIIKLIHAGHESEAEGNARTTSVRADINTATSTIHDRPSHANWLPPISAAKSALNFKLTQIKANAATILLLVQTSTTLAPSNLSKVPTRPKTSSATGTTFAELEATIRVAAARDLLESFPTLPRLVNPSFAKTSVPTFTHTPVRSVKYPWSQMQVRSTEHEVGPRKSEHCKP
mmetsp:Transcript_56732/g.124388  ORF Transcript_56732/g.124388 Transcript_56732/m.124388 type:complete len:236 (-) Transcript_56732:618-1325(-)